MANQKPTKEQLKQWHKDPSNWVWGMFYCNKADKRLLPPKKIPAMGWTVNFANRNSVLLLVTFLVVIAVMLYASSGFSIN
jgi:uncharacterized membrane protein